MIVSRTIHLNRRLISKSFEFSLGALELYIKLLKRNELELSQKLLFCSTAIRRSAEGALASVKKQDFVSSVSLGLKDAVEARYWLKMLQMKSMVDEESEGCVEQLNEIINILNYLMQENNKYKIQLNLQNLN